VEDIAIMSAIPNLTVFTPSDADEVRKTVRAAAAVKGPVYIRITRTDVPAYTKGQFIPGKLSVLRGNDICGLDAECAIIAHGIMIEAAVNACEILEKNGIRVAVINAGTMKPFDTEGVLEIAKRVKAIVTAEDHSYIGGLASLTAMALRKSSVPMDYVAIEDMFGQSAHSVESLLKHYGLTSGAIAEKAAALINKSIK